MKKIICFTLILVLFSVPALSFKLDKDKEKHIKAGISTYLIADLLELDNPINYVILAGISKEIWDLTVDKQEMDEMDIIATIFGGYSIKIIF